MSTEYVDDVPYVRHFIEDLSPTRLRLVAALNGLVPPPDAELDYCELGCGHGDTLAALAAAYPNGRFLGVDLGAAHIASAKRLAREGGIDNVGFLERDFADLVREDTGEFDYVVAHGVLSWLSPEKRHALIDFARTKLKPGGLLFVSYNAMPGWSSIEPLRQLLLFPSSNAGAGETTLERARRGLEFAKSMRDAGAEYFTRNPAAAEMLQTMERVGLPYVVHEYMHEHWSPMYFARVAWEMATSDLHYAGSLPIHTNFRDAAVSEPLERALASTTDRATFESLKDIAVDQFFRRDIFVKGRAVRSSAATSDYLDATPWGRLANGPPERTIQLPHRAVHLAGPAFDTLLTALGEGTVALPQLAENGAHDLDALRAAMIRLLVVEHAVPLTMPTRAVTPPPDDTYVMPCVYNQAMLRRAATDIPLVLTSNVAGTAFPISALEALALRVLTEVPAPERASWVRDFIGRSVLRFRIGARVIEDRGEQIETLLGTLDNVRAERLAKLLELGILAPSTSASARCP